MTPDNSFLEGPTGLHHGISIISVFLGLIIAAKWPVSGLFVIGVFVAIELIIHGWSYIFIALAAKSALETSPAEA